jgi:hypothetical protein
MPIAFGFGSFSFSLIQLVFYKLKFMTPINISKTNRGNIQVKGAIEVIMLEIYSLEHVQSLVIVHYICFLTYNLIFNLLFRDRNASF